MKQEKFKFKVGEEKLSVLKVVNAETDKVSLLFLHGAGTSTKERSSYLAESLASHGIGSVSFDFSGHGESTGRLSSSSLAKRVVEAREAIQYVDKPIAVLGASMGAYIAIKLLEYTEIQTLILFCPAIYTEKAFKASFGKDFGNIIRQQNSWRESDVLPLLEAFTGNLLIVIGEEDNVIPPEIITLLDTHSLRAKKKKIVRIPGCSHQLHSFLQANAKGRNHIIEKIVEMLVP